MRSWPSTKAQRVLAALHRIGWTLKRRSGSQKTLSRPGRPDLLFAFHDPKNSALACWRASRSAQASGLMISDGLPPDSLVLAEARASAVFCKVPWANAGGSGRQKAETTRRHAVGATDRVGLPTKMPGLDFLHDRKGRRKAVLIDRRKHKRLWEDLYDAYTARRRRAEPRKCLATVKRLIEARAARKARG